MALETWIAFCVVNFTLLVTPGPITFFIMSSTLSLGRRRAIAIIPGVVLGDLIAMTASLFGAGLLMSQSPHIFFLLKIVGAIVLLVLGLRMIFSAIPRFQPEIVQSSRARARLFFAGFAMAVLHPSGFIFFTAFAPQFIDPAQPFLFQSTILLSTFLILGGLTSLGWLYAVDRLKALLSEGAALRRLQQLGGLLLVLVSLLSVVRAV